MKTVVPYTDMDRVQKEGTLYIPEHIQKDNTPLPSTGIVLSVGEDVSQGDREIIEEGTMVMFSKFAGTDFVVDHEDFKILDMKEVMCTLIDTQDVVVPVVEG